MKQLIKNYSGIILLIIGITTGSFIGIFFPKAVDFLKPLGDIFLNLLFVSVVPLVFFTVSNSIASLEEQSKFGKIIFSMIFTFLLFIIIAALFTITAVYFFPTEALPSTSKEILETGNNATWGDRIVSFFTVGEFTELFSRKNMLALLIFAFLTGTAARKTGDAGKHFTLFLASGYEVMKELLLLVMKAAPIGLGAYFAYQVATVGPQLFGFYAKPLGLYYAAGVVYFLVFFSIYAFAAKGKDGVKIFWKNNIYPSLTAISTCSSFATMPANLQAAARIGVPDAIANIVIPIGSTLHKNGSSMSSIIKIYVAFLIIGRDFFDPMNLLLALGITIFVSIVAGGIPNGGYIGEMLMISVYQLPVEAIPAVMIIGTLVDPLATVLNSTGDTVAAMFVTKISGEKFQEPKEFAV
ncbi:dicarboxylate/amino acid:cation symporter [Chryseobacterium manosquense]|uniref:Dicarboxylate/amino acid:cation symporter n=1 Tax=Chryseobacterium manosquense TaxID=2754694 RepID=A0A7H1DTE1_9FLAO|nr:dicarboxylate/amino acid:cation symporter [Chryseobacterium manosquense]QNS40249.1 dicarboxylate/amino acid:cation symporter [Chryseobacterium manosquense]